jgi:hypothetical protein
MFGFILYENNFLSARQRKGNGRPEYKADDITAICEPIA